MAGQVPTRRELLQALGLASAASLFQGFSRWSYALAEPGPQHSHATSPRPHPEYHPQFFSPDQYQTVELLVELILPATIRPVHLGSKAGARRAEPGAKEAGVAEFIDFMVFSDPAQQAAFRDGLSWLDQASKPAASFVSLQSREQTAILDRLAYRANFRDGEKAGQQFFQLFRKYTVTGFYTSRVGLQALDYPGLTFYGTSPECTHDDNREHVGL